MTLDKHRNKLYFHIQAMNMRTLKLKTGVTCKFNNA